MAITFEDFYRFNEQLKKAVKTNPNFANVISKRIEKVVNHRIYFTDNTNCTLRNLYDAINPEYPWVNRIPSCYVTNFSLLKAEVEYQLNQAKTNLYCEELYYDGELGTFKYNPKEFCIIDNPPFSSYLSYIGKETDGSKIKIPKGIISCYCMFEDCKSLEKAPTIPNGVTFCREMFYGCTSLKEAHTIPNGVTNCQSMFQGCTSLKKAPTIPNGVTNCLYMFKDCKSLVKAPTIPNGVEDCACMFNGCISLKEVPTIPKSVSSDYLGCSETMFKNCSEKIQKIGKYMIEHRGITFEEAKKALNIE